MDLLAAGHQRPCDGGSLTQNSALNAMDDGPTPFEQELGLAEVSDDAGSTAGQTDTVAEAPTQDEATDGPDDLVEDGANVVPLTVGDQAALPSVLNELASAEANTASSVVVISEPQVELGADVLLDPSVGSAEPDAVEQASGQKPTSAPVVPAAETLTGDAPALVEAGVSAIDSEAVEQPDGVAKSITTAAPVADKSAPRSDEGGQTQPATVVREGQPPVSTGLEGTNVSDHESDGQPATDDGEALPQATAAAETSGDFDEALPVASGAQVDVTAAEDAHPNSPTLSTSTETTIPTPADRPAETGSPVQELVAPARDDQAAVEAFRTVMVERIAQAAQNYLRDGQSQMRIRLNPPELGEMRVHFSMDGESASAEVTVTKPEAAQLIMQHIEQLRRSLAQVGVELGSFDVREHEAPHGGQQQNGQSGSDRDWQDTLSNLDLGMDSEEAELDKPEEVSPGLVTSWQASLTAGHSSFDAIA